MLKIEGLVKRFGGVTALDGVTLTVAERTITGLIGPNGAGKTTLFNCVSGALAPTAGAVVFEGRDITGLPAHRLFEHGIVRTFQIPHEFHRLTTRENLMVVPSRQAGASLLKTWLQPARVRRDEEEARSAADEVLAFLDLSPVADLPAGNLSGGQKKLLEIGRAMMARPRLVLLDEPGAGVNPNLLRAIAEMILRLRDERGYTFCVIEHDMDLIARICDPVIVFAEGRVLIEGGFAEVRRDPRVLEAYLGGGAAQMAC